MVDHLNISIQGEELWLSSRRCIWWPAKMTLIVSDLHLGKGIFYSKVSNLLPPYDTIDTLNRLRQLIEELKPERVISLGDSFHHKNSFDSLQEYEKQMIHELVTLVDEWVWIMGNHDYELPSALYGLKVKYINEKQISFYHQPNTTNNNDFQIVGHFHPKYTKIIKGRRLSKPCFIWAKNVMIMPAFGSYTGGLDIDHPEIIKMLSKPFKIATADTKPHPVLIVKR